MNVLWNSRKFIPYFWVSSFTSRNANHSRVLSTSFCHSLLKLLKMRRWLNVDDNMWPHLCMSTNVMWLATFDGICFASFLFSKYQYFSSSTSIKVMMCTVFGNNNVVTMSFGKDSMYDLVIKNFWNIQMNNEYFLFISMMIYIFAKR